MHQVLKPMDSSLEVRSPGKKHVEMMFHSEKNNSFLEKSHSYLKIWCTDHPTKTWTLLPRLKSLTFSKSATPNLGDDFYFSIFLRDEPMRHRQWLKKMHVTLELGVSGCFGWRIPPGVLWLPLIPQKCHKNIFFFWGGNQTIENRHVFCDFEGFHLF